MHVHAGRGGGCAVALLFLTFLAFPRNACAVPSFARQTGMPCAQCHTLSFGPALTAYGRQFKLNGYTFGEVDSQMPLALMIQGGLSRADRPLPAAPAPHFSNNNNISLDQVSVFAGTRLTEHVGMLGQATYSGEKRHFNWDNTDIRYTRLLTLLGTDAVVGISVNNNPTVQDLWNSTPAWGYPYISSPLLPTPAANPIITGALAQLVLGATAYTMIRDHVYLEAGAYRGLSDRWLNNVGLYSSANPLTRGGAPYWRAVYQFSEGEHREHYYSVGTFGLNVKVRPDPSVPDTNRFTDLGFDAVYQYTDGGPGAILANASYIHEQQNLTATFNAGGSDNPTNHLNVFRLDASYAYRQTWSAGVGVFDTRGGTDRTFYSSGALTGSSHGSPDTRGYILQFECVPLGKLQSWGRPWANVRVGLQYTGYLRFNGGTANYDGFGRSAGQNDSLFLFLWMAF
jgi:hypothetical protein